MPKQDLGFEIFYDGAWHDAAGDGEVFANTVSINRGKRAEGTAFEPATIVGQLDNRTDRYRISNPESPLYGLAGRNTPVRVSVAGSVRGTAEASSWSTDQTRDFRRAPARGRAWTDLKAGGLLQRINQWTEPLESPFYAYNSTLPNLLGYWSHEDPKGTRRLFTPVDGARSGVLQGAEFGGDRFAGSSPLASFKPNSGSKTQGFFAPTAAGDTDGWQISWCIKPGSLGTTGDVVNLFSFSTRDGTSYSLVFVDGTDVLLLADDINFVSLINASQDISGNGTNWNLWQNFIVKATYSAGTVTIRVYYNTQGSDSFVSWANTFSGITSQPSDWNTVFGAQNDVGFGHVVAISGTSPDFFSVDRLNAFKGYPDETVADRFDRLCTLKGIDFTIIGTGADSMPMGPQPVATLADHFKEMVATEDALIFDDIDAIALVLMLRNARYNQSPALTLTATDLPALPKEVTDDLGTANVVTAQQRDGGVYTAVDDTSPMGSQDPPDGVGEARQAVGVNLSDPDTDLAQEAFWWLGRGTVALPRYPQVAINLAALPELVPAVEAVDVGQVIELVGVREETIRLYVLGWQEVIGTHGRMITFVCAPDQQFVVGVYDDVARYDLATCTLNGSVAPTGTSLVFAITSRYESWSTTAVPYDLMISGQRVTVTSMGAVSGSGPYAQTATVIRGVNGISKTLPDGAAVHVASQGRWAL